MAYYGLPGGLAEEEAMQQLLVLSLGPRRSIDKDFSNALFYLRLNISDLILYANELASLSVMAS